MVRAPTIRAAITAASPTEPVPKIAMLALALTAREFTTVPVPSLQATAQGREQLQRQRLWDLHQVAFGRQCMGGE